MSSKYLDKFTISDCEYRIAKLGYVNALYQIINEMDCTVVLPSGARPMQTNNYQYKELQEKFKYIMDKADKDNGFIADEKYDIVNAFVQRKKDNNTYEDSNPPIVYAKSQVANKTVRRKTAVKDKANINAESSIKTPRKGSIKSDKLAIIASKIKGFSIKDYG